jgi:hypothetical protein
LPNPAASTMARLGILMEAFLLKIKTRYLRSMTT